MTLIKKSDVQSYFAARRKKTVFPFAPGRQSSAIGRSETGSGSPVSKKRTPGYRQASGASDVSASAIRLVIKSDPPADTSGSPVGVLAAKAPQA
jgi:hypothetical protein